MTIPPRFTPTIASATALDRDPEARAEALAMAASDPATRVALIVNGRVLIRANAERTEASIRWLGTDALAGLGVTGTDAIDLFLGRDPATGAARLAQCISVPDVEALKTTARLPGPLVDLRSLALQGVMSADDLSLVGAALMLAHWHEGARFCGRCGAPTTITDGGWKRVCGPCGRDLFPRIDPVVIMLVTDGKRAVLSREPRFPDGMVSTLAGFIEPGEDIVHAVRREVREEIGLETDAVRFIASQPWPFPHSLMIGCIAHATTTTLKPDPAEISHARWVDPAEMRLALEHRHPEGLRMPGKQSLADVLARTWLGEVEGADA